MQRMADRFAQSRFHRYWHEYGVNAPFIQLSRRLIRMESHFGECKLQRRKYGLDKTGVNESKTRMRREEGKKSLSQQNGLPKIPSEMTTVRGQGESYWLVKNIPERKRLLNDLHIYQS